MHHSANPDAHPASADAGGDSSLGGRDRARSVNVAIGRTGGIAFAGWTDKGGVSDLCAYRALTVANSAILRRAIARAEAMQGRKLDARAIAAGVHSHDGGATWGAH